MIKNILLSTTLIFIFSACSDNEIPTSDSSKQVDWNSLKDSKKVEIEVASNDEVELEVLTPVDPIPTFPNSKDELAVTDENYTEEEAENYSSEDSEEVGDIEDEKSENSEEIAEKDEDIVEDIQEVENQDFSEYEKELESQMTKALANYPRPPTPANLSPYDSRESSSYREPTKQETTSSSGDFPPSPPAMMLNANN